MSRLPAAKRKEQLLDCAADLFARHGYARATTSELAKAAGVTEPIIYRHFKSKRELFIALIERSGRETLRQWEQDLKDAEDPAERLRRLIGDNPMVSERGRAAYRVFLQAITEVDDPEIHEALVHHIRSLHDFIAEELVRAQEKGRVTPRFTATILGWLLIYLGLGYGVAAAMQVQGHGRDQTGLHVQDVIARILVGRGGGADKDAQP